MRIKEAAEKLNLSARAIRFYEEKGLIAPAKDRNNRYREFGEQDIWRLQTIVALRESGMSVEAIKEVLEDAESREEDKLSYYLELQRSALVSKWLEIRQLIETTDEMIGIVRERKTLPPEDIYKLAEGSRRLREHRNSWTDRWNYDRLAEGHDQRVLRDSERYPDYEAALDAVVEWVRPAAGERGLDIGTGTGNLAGRLMERGAVMAGVDQSREMLNICRRKFPGMETRLGNFLAVPYLDDRFDFIVSSFAFHHLAVGQQMLAVNEMRRVLKSHGRICIADLMVSQPENRPKAAGAKPESAVSLSGLLRLLADAGFKVHYRRLNEWLHVVCAESS